MPLRPSQLDIMAFICWAAYSASTQPVSLLVALPLPQMSSGPEKVVLLAESWHFNVVADGSVMLKLLPEPLVAKVSGLGPLYAALPLPWTTCSLVPRTAPSCASTYTDWRDTSPASWPETVVS